MVSKSTDSSEAEELNGEQVSTDLGFLTYKINQLKKQIQAERFSLIKERVEKNKKSLENDVSRLLSLAMSRTVDSSVDRRDLGNTLSSNIKNPPYMLSGSAQGSGDKDNSSTQEVAICTSTRLPIVEKIPPYTTWIFLHRNQRMAVDQSVVGRRRIYYDQHGSEALICSDSEEEIAEPDEEKHDFSEAENRIIQMVCKDYEPSKEVLKILMQFIGGTTSEIQEVYNLLKTKNQEKLDQNVSASVEVENDRNIFLEKSLSASLDSLDNLFCRRCLIFDCRLHGYSQAVITSTERQYYPLGAQEDGKPCSEQCYLQLQTVKKHPKSLGALRKPENRTSEECLYEFSSSNDAGKCGDSKQTQTMLEEPSTDDQQKSSHKKQKRLSIPETESMAIEDTQVLDENLNEKTMDLEVSVPDKHELQTSTNNEATSSGDAHSSSFSVSRDTIMHSSKGESKGSSEGDVVKDASVSMGIQVEGSARSSQWKPLEKELYLKGLEIFGRNSCLISRNLLSGLKTCKEVFSYMYDTGSVMSQRSLTACSTSEDNERTGADDKEQEMPPRSRLLRRKGKTRKLKYSWKSAGHPSIWRRIADGKNQSCKQYLPCGCKSMCGKQCPCLDNATCCEKYCGCSKNCKNRFRGCHCAKSRCRSRLCPCFAAGRECDPDVCRNCWVSCGDGSLDEPSRREGQCGNMRLFLRQQQRILLAKSDVAGWGAFLKNSVNKNDYLGEYTGELISHREADKRGKIYDRANSSFLFDLNDQYVLDAYRKGDKLKFANHSSNPNCYAKVMLVAGDHRVGIFAKERIEAGEELFYDYRYGPDQAPAWARKPDDGKGDEFLVPQSRAKKHQSHR